MPLLLSSSVITPLLHSLTPSDLHTLSASLSAILVTNPPSLQPARTRLTTPNGTLTLVMPATSAALTTTSVKTVNIPLPSAPISATITLHDSTTGHLRAVLSGTVLTSFRTALCSLLLLPKTTPPKHIAVFGTGPVAQWTVYLLHRFAAPTASITVVARGAGRTMPAWTGPSSVVSVGEIGSEAVLKSLLGRCEAVFCCTSAKEPLFPSEWLQGCAYLSLVGSHAPDMCEVDPALLRQDGARVVVDARACCDEAGEVVAAGLGPDDVDEICEVLNAQDGEMGEGAGLTVFKCAGLAIMDLWIGLEVCGMAEERALGVQLDEWE